MRIGLIVSELDASDRQSTAPALHRFVHALAGQDDVRVLPLRASGAGEYDALGADVLARGAQPGAGVQRVLRWPRALGVLRAEHRRWPFDVLHALGSNEAGALAAVAGRLLRVSTIVSLIDGELVAYRDAAYGELRTWTGRWAARLALHYAGAVTAGTRSLLNLAAAWLPAVGAQARYLPLGVDLSLFAPRAAAGHSDDLHLLNVAPLTPINDHVTLLRALHGIRQHTPAVLRIAGAGPQRAALEAQARELHLEESVEFLDGVPYDRLPGVYREADLYVSSARYAAQGVAVLQAAACRLPIVGTPAGVVEEFAPDAAVAVPAGDAAAFAAAAVALWTEPARRAALSEAAYERARAAYSLELCVERFRALYAELAAGA